MLSPEKGLPRAIARWSCPGGVSLNPPNIKDKAKKKKNYKATAKTAKNSKKQQKTAKTTKTTKKNKEK